MAFFQLIPVYLLWHYGVAWVDLARLYSNFAWFLFHFFSIPLLLRTLLAPWKRLHESRAAHGGAGFLGAFLINSITRIVGAVIRLATIAVGISAQALLVALFIAVLLLWLVMPFFLLWLAVNGLTHLVS